MIRRIALQCFLCLIFFVTPYATAKVKDHLHKSWEFHLADIVNNEGEIKSKDITVFGLEFSPDGKQIVAVIGTSLKNQFVLILDAADPNKNRQKFDIKLNFYKSTTEPFPIDLFWPSPGKYIAIGHTLMNLSNGKFCTLPEKYEEKPPYYLSIAGSDRIVGYRSDLFYYFDWECQKTGQIKSSDPSHHWTLLDASADRELICIEQEIIKNLTHIRTDVYILDAINKNPAMLVPFIKLARFAENGKVICGLVGKDWHQKVSCRDVDTGKEIAISKEHRYCDIRPALSAPRIVISDYGRTIDFIDLRWAQGGRPHRIIWDYKTGEELVSWKADIQYYKNDAYEWLPEKSSQPYSFAISPDGEYLVEGGEGILNMYKIVP